MEENRHVMLVNPCKAYNCNFKKKWPGKNMTEMSVNGFGKTYDDNIAERKVYKPYDLSAFSITQILPPFFSMEFHWV